MVTNDQLKNMFSTEGSNTASNGGNQLAATAQLTNMASEIADVVMQTAANDLDTYGEQLQASKTSHDAMDQLITNVYDLQVVDVEFLKTEDSETLDKMIRSQQSKRSRAKSKAMTMENYETMMIGAISENLLRIAAGKPKLAGGSFSVANSTLTEEQLQELANDEEKLKKAIRNVQSKKSIYKSKADFDEESDRWAQLLQEEATLKALRDGQSHEVVKAVETQQKVQEMLASADLKDLKADDAKSMLAQIAEMLNS